MVLLSQERGGIERERGREKKSCSEEHPVQEQNQTSLASLNGAQRANSNPQSQPKPGYPGGVMEVRRGEVLVCWQ